MKNFKELNIAPVVIGFVGAKIDLNTVLNKEITVLDYKVVPSKYKEKGSGKCLHLQIDLNAEKRVIFTGSRVLEETILRVPKEDFPFKTTIIKTNGRVDFT